VLWKHVGPTLKHENARLRVVSLSNMCCATIEPKVPPPMTITSKGRASGGGAPTPTSPPALVSASWAVLHMYRPALSSEKVVNSGAVGLFAIVFLRRMRAPKVTNQSARAEAKWQAYGWGMDAMKRYPLIDGAVRGKVRRFVLHLRQETTETVATAPSDYSQLRLDDLALGSRRRRHPQGAARLNTRLAGQP
jgi:hypothetical protein